MTIWPLLSAAQFILIGLVGRNIYRYWRRTDLPQEQRSDFLARAMLLLLVVSLLAIANLVLTLVRA